MVTSHDFCGPTLLGLQLSDVNEKAAEPESVIDRLADADPPELVSVNFCDTVSPEGTKP